MKKLTTEDFIIRSKNIHGNKYDYSSVLIEGSRKKVKLFCLIHGEFFISPNNHLQGKQCKKCSLEERGNPNKIAKLKRNCPNCNEEIKYISKYGYSIGNKRKTLCNKCSFENKHKNLLNTKFGRLTLIKIANTKIKGRNYCEFLCDCGKTINKKLSEVKSGNIKTCGCFDNKMDKSPVGMELEILVDHI